MHLEDVLQKSAAVAREVAAPEALETDTNYTWVEKTMHAMQQEGLAGLVVPKTNGGLGMGMEAMARVSEILGEASGSAGLCFGMHCVGTAVIAAKATDEQAAQFLEPIAQGKHITTLALSEPGTGAHFYIPQTKLKKSEEGYTINGKKTFITNGAHADSYVVSTVGADENAAPHEFSMVVVPKSIGGLKWGNDWKGLGMRGNSSLSAELNNVQIPASHLVGEKGDQIWYVFNVVAPYFLMAMAGTYLGIAQSALNEAKEHLAKRTYSHSGRRLSEVQLLQHKLGMLWTKVEYTRRLIYNAAEKGDAGDENALMAILGAKAKVAETVVEIVNEAMTLMGGIAYRDSSKMDRLLRDARAAHVMAPTTDILYTWLGRSLLNLPVLGD